MLDVLEKKSAAFDAIIVDAIVDSIRDRYKGLRELLSRLRRENIPIYVYTDVEDEWLQDDLSAEEYQYLLDGKLFRRSEENSIDRLVRNLRNELDGVDNQTADIRGQYIREFEAASWLEFKRPKLNLVSNLTFCFSQPNANFSKIRVILNGLYKAMMIEISNGSGLDRVQTVGMLPRLLRDGYFIHQNKVVFKVERSIMPLPLAIALCYASQIVNAAEHAEDVEKMDIQGYLAQVRSDHLAHSVLRIVMDFILWLYEVHFEFDGFCVSEDVNTLHKVNWCGILKQAGWDEYYCDSEAGRVHVNMGKTKPKLNAQIAITQVRYETHHRDKYKWFTNTWTYKGEDE